VNILTSNSYQKKQWAQKIGDMGVVKAFNRGRENYNRINLSPSASDDKNKPPKPTAAKKPDQKSISKTDLNMPKKLKITHRAIKPHEVARRPEDVQKDTYIRDDQNNAYMWNGTDWLMKSKSEWKNTNMNKQQMFNMYKSAVNDGNVLVPRQSNVRENDTMNNEKDTAQDKSNNAKINPVRLAKYLAAKTL
jgi:hypothetical protein